jgi:hypothetical protein
VLFGGFGTDLTQGISCCPNEVKKKPPAFIIAAWVRTLRGCASAVSVGAQGI